MRIGIILTGDYNWAGGVYYSLNIVKLFSQIAETKKLTVVVITNTLTPADVLREIPSQHTEIIDLDKKSVFYKTYHKLKGDRMVADLNTLKLDILYPFITYENWHAKLNCTVYYWLFDFQHRHLPKMFMQEEFDKRELNFKQITKKAKNIVFSSYNAQEDFHQFYGPSEAKLHVFQFVSLMHVPSVVKANADYPSKYFIVCNQFWPHKNHLIVLKALAKIKKEAGQVKVIFTGKFDYASSKDYVDMLNTFIDQNAIREDVYFTGFLSREDQIALIQNALAVIQPSLFEGWSTVIEDAKALNKFVVASNIQINQEQLNDNVLFFDPNNELELSKHLLQLNDHAQMHCDSKYDNNIIKSKKDLIDIFKIQ